MRKIIYLVFLCTSLFACQDVVELDLKTAEPRLVIDASLTWFKDTTGKNQFIKLSLTSSFYSKTTPPATGATVSVTDQNNNTFNFIEEDETGIYRNQSFIPEINGVYNLKIIYKNEVYTATETMQPVVNIDRIEQKNDSGFNKDETEIKAFYTDPKNIENYYLFEFINANSSVLSLDVYSDKFNDGNQIFAFYSNEDVKPGDELIIQGHGVSKRFYQYMFILLQQSSDDSGGPFQTQPATVRGNCVNQTNPSNYPYGYFRASEVAVFKYIVK
ncbi:MAG: DUF4249 domain-containing protein [Confluentibacter sp.]|nr:DUF4249 domain-containing protein [Confluentibacter sp.]